MNNLEFGLQLYSVRKALAKDEWGTLRKVAEIGYKNLELSAPEYRDGKPAPAHTAAETRAFYRDLGLRAVSIAMPVDFHREIEDWRRLADYSGEIGCEAVCCSVATFPSRDEALRLAEFFNAVGAYAAESGQKFYYHNHYHEFQRFGGETVLDTLCKNTDARYVDFELDTFWTLRGGADPIEVMDALGDRLKIVHQKDMSAGVSPVNLFEIIPEGTVIDWDIFVKYATNPASFAELGRGAMDVPGLLEKARRMPSVSFAIVEQDETAIGEFESARVNFEYMQKML